jgi:hypothetical protein
MASIEMLKIAACFLIAFDRFEQCFEIANAEALKTRVIHR